MLDGNGDWPNGVPIAGTLLVIALVSAGVFAAGGYATDVDDRFVGDRSPQASFAFAYDEDTERLTVEYVAGTDVANGRLLVVAGDEVVGNFSRYDTVGAGDEVTVERVAPNEDVRVVWQRGTRRVELARWRGH